MNQRSDLPDNSIQPLSSGSSLSNGRPEERMAVNLPDTSAGGAHGADEEGFDWRRFVGVLRRRRKVIGFTLAGVMSLAAIYLALTPRVYQASADLLINTDQKSSGQENSLPAIQDLLDATSTRSQDTEVEILRSATVQDGAIDLVPKAMRPTIQKKVEVDIQPKRSTDIVTVNVKSRDPKMAMAFANAVCKSYQLQSQENNTAQYREAAAYVGGQLAMVRKKLDQKRNELKNFKQATGIVDLTSDTQVRVARLNELQTALQQAQTDRASSEAQLKTLRAQAAGMAPAEIAPSTIVVRPVVQQLKQQLTALEVQRAATFQEFVPGSSEVKALDDQIAALRRRLRTEATTEVGTYTRNINPVRQAVMQSISQIQANVWAAQAREQALQQNLAGAHQSVQQLPQNEYRLSQLQGDLAIFLATFQTLSDKYQTLLISQQTPITNARIISPANEAPKVSPSVGRTLVLALVTGLMLALALATALDRLDNKIYTEDDAVQATGLPVLTHVPMLNLKKGQRILIDTSGSSTLSKVDSSILLESFRILRTQLSFISSYGHLKTLVLTSSQPGEGKSTVSVNLAMALALNGKRVVVVDADLRRPRVHKLFQIDNARGFTSVVANTCSLEEALHNTGIEGLQVLPAGPTPPNPPELLDSRVARDIIEHLKTTVDYVIIDAPPALMLADAQVVSTMADGVLLVVSCQEATRGAVERMTEMMTQSGVKVVGMVLNKFTHEQGSYGYYGYSQDSYARYLDS